MPGEDSYYPGVQVIERPFQANATASAEATAVGAFIGKSNQGPITPTKVSSWTDFTRQFGTTYTDLHGAVNDFYANGGRTAYIQRIAGANAMTASVDIFADDAPMDPGNPGQVLPGTTPLFTVEALSPGAWGNKLHVIVSARDSLNKRFDLAVYNVPSTVSFDPTKRNSEYLVEQWVDLTLDSLDSRYIYDVVNAPSATGSSTVTVYGQSYDPATPNTRPYPDAVGDNQLTGGVDGSYTAPAFDSDAAYLSDIDAMSAVPGPYVLNIPNVNDPDIIRYAATQAATRGDVFVVVDPPSGKTPAEMQSFIDTDLAIGTLGVSTPSYVGVYYPWLYLPALGTNSTGRTSLRPPGGAIVGVFMSNDTTYGVGKAPAGVTTKVMGAVRTERTLLDADLTKLNNMHVNVIRPVSGQGIVVMGARTLKKSGDDRYVNVRRSIIYLRETLRRSTEFAAFRSNDYRLWADLTATCDRVLGSFWQSGGLAGATASEAYFVRCDSSNNDASSIASGTVNIEVGVAVAKPAEFIVITIGQFDGGSTVTTTI